MTISRNARRKSKKTNRRARRSEGEDIAKPLLSFLNPRKEFRLERTGRGVVKRDLVVHERGSHLHKILRGWKRLDRMRRTIDSRSLPHEHRHTRRRCIQLAEILSIRMGKFATRPGVITNELHLVGVGQRGSGEGFEYRSSWDGDDFYKWVRHPVGITSFSLEETQAFFAFEEIIKRRWLWKLRLCIGCREKWFWVKQRNQECCSPSCKQTKWRQRRKANLELQRGGICK